MWYFQWSSWGNVNVVILVGSNSSYGEMIVLIKVWLSLQYWYWWYAPCQSLFCYHAPLCWKKHYLGISLVNFCTLAPTTKNGGGGDECSFYTTSFPDMSFVRTKYFVTTSLICLETDIMKYLNFCLYYTALSQCPTFNNYKAKL